MISEVAQINAKLKKSKKMMNKRKWIFSKIKWCSQWNQRIGRT